MQRYPANSLGGGVSNNTVGGQSSRDNARVDLPFSTSNFPLNSRRPSSAIPYKLKCDKEPLNGRLGPPDFFPQTPNCPEEILTREYAQSGYKETVEGIEEAREIVLTQAPYFSKSEIILKCKEAIRKRLKAINESRTQKRKAGQVYGVPLAGSLLVKTGVFPDQKACTEDSRRKWIEALSQPNKRLRSLVDHIPHGYRRKSLFEVLIRNNVPLLKATWFVKVTYLNQVRSASISVSSGAPDKAQFARSDLWTKDVTEYLNQLLDEFLSKDGFTAKPSGRDLLGQTQQRIELVSAAHDAEEPSLQFKWCYMLRLLSWHYAEGLVIPSVIIEWVLSQLQERESSEALELLLPVVCDVIESISLSQTYVRSFVDIAVRFINDLCPVDSSSLNDSKIPPLASALIDMLHYLILSVPDTFVALDCFQLLTCVVPDVNYRNTSERLPEYEEHDILAVEDAKVRSLSFSYLISTIRKRASNLTKIVNPSFQGHGAAKVLQVLDKTLLAGDVRPAYSSLFEDLSDVIIEERWIAEVSPCLRASLSWVGLVSLSLVCSVFFLCEWATCDYRDCRTSLPHNLKLTGGKDFAQVYAAILLLKLKKEGMHKQLEAKNGSNSSEIHVSLHENVFSGSSLENASARHYVNDSNGRKRKVDIFQSPGPLHDIIVCWLDQHETGRGRSFKRLQVLLVELIRNGIFYPQAYLRQLIVSGLMDRTETSFDLERRGRHHQILRQLPGTCLFDALEEARIAEPAVLYETMNVYSNERRLVLNGHLGDYSSNLKADTSLQRPKDHSDAVKNGRFFTLESRKKTNIAPRPFNRKSRMKNKVAELKGLISTSLRLPYSCSLPVGAQLDESQGIVKPLGSLAGKVDPPDGTPGCEECRRSKRQKRSDERSPSYQAFSLNQSDEEDIWWVRKGLKTQDSYKADLPLKLTKHASRGRQKTVRKTQSLAQLAATKVESNQGASTSHICDNKVSCPHHKSGNEDEVSKDVEHRVVHIADVGKGLKQLRLLESRAISTWLLTSVRQLVEGNEKSDSRLNNCSGALPLLGDDNNMGWWKLGEGELFAILFVLDISCDLILAIRFILWLLPKIVCALSSPGHVGRNVMIHPKSREVHALQVGEAVLISALQRYESVIVAADLLPEVLTALMHRIVSIMASGGRVSSSAAFGYARNLLKKYKDVASVIKWEKAFRPTCDQRLLAELDAGRTLDGDLGFSSVGMNDFDEYFRHKLSGRIPRTGPTMKEIVQRHVDEAVHYFCGKERKVLAGGIPKSSPEKWDDPYQVAQDIVQGLVDCIRQNGGATLEGDPSIVVSAVSSIISNVGPAVVKLLDITPSSNCQNFSSSTTGPYSCVRYVMHIHITSMCLLKEALGERFSRIFDLAVAAEASSAVSGAFVPGKIHRNQFQPPPETHDINSNLANDVLNNSTKLFAGRVTKAAAAVSALVVGAIIHGVASLERMIVVFRLKEGLDVLQFIRSTRTSSNGTSRGSFKLEYGIEVYVHWFRLLVGNCRTIFDGLVAEILGEPYILALSRLQRMLPLSLVFPPAYSIFAMVIWRPYIVNSNMATREDIQLYHYLSLAIGDAIRHHPFRDICLRNTHAFYDLLASDTGDSEFAAMLEMHNPDKHLKTMAFVPLRARIFLNAIIDCRMPPFTILQEDSSWVSRQSETRAHMDNEAKFLDKLVHVFDSLQPAKFHWQWVELRLLLNEQALVEKIETKDMSFVEAIRSLSPNAENFAVSESEKFLSEIVLTRILVRPDAAPLYAEVAHLLGRSLEESLVMDIKWILAGSDVLPGRKSIRQQLISVAQRKGLSTKAQFWKPWGWSGSTGDAAFSRGDRSKLEPMSIEEGEVVDESINVKRLGKTNSSLDAEAFDLCQYSVTEKALADLILPCIDKSSTDLRNSFAAELIKQMSAIDQQINILARGGSKQASASSPGIEGASNKNSSRKGMRGGSPGLGRRPTGIIDSTPPSAAALKASLWLRLQFLVRLLPIVYADREPSPRNMRHTLTSIILHLLGTRFIHEDANLSLSAAVIASSLREAESCAEASATSVDHSGDSLFDIFLSVMHGLLSSCKPSWLKAKAVSKSTVKSPRDFSAFDRDVAESLLAELDRMELPATIRRRLQSAMPILPTSLPLLSSCQPPTLPPSALSSLQPSTPTQSTTTVQRLLPISRPSASVHAKNKSLALLDSDFEIDPWTLLEEGTVPASASSSSNSIGALGGDHSNLKASSWLKGAVRVRRKDLTYVGGLDDDS